MANPLDLDQRQQLPLEWLFLLQEHPREDWLAHENFGPLTEYWLNRHDGFRNVGNALIALLRQFREGQIAPQNFGSMLVPLLEFWPSSENPG